MESDIGKRIESLARGYADAKCQLESNFAVQKRLRGCKVVLPKKVNIWLESYQAAANGLKKLGVDVDTGLVGKLREDFSLGEIVDKGGYLVLRNISCVDSDGVEFERYEELFVAKDIVRNVDGSQVNFTPYAAVVHFEKEGRFCPSFALSCNILQALYENKGDSEVNKVLMQYKGRSNSYGYHLQNTIVDWSNREIIHYPSDSDFPYPYGGEEGINGLRTRVERKFDPKNFGNMLLEVALKISEFNNYIKNFTGLKKPEILVEIGQYFNKPAKIWIPSGRGVRAVWLGCVNDNFDINSSSSLINDIAARGVRN